MLAERRRPQGSKTTILRAPTMKSPTPSCTLDSHFVDLDANAPRRRQRSPSTGARPLLYRRIATRGFTSCYRPVSPRV